MDKLPSESMVGTKLDLEDFAYQLPQELIARTPAEKRDESRLLCYKRKDKNISHLSFRDIGSVLKADDVLVVNNTRVIPAKLIGQRKSGGAVELLLVKKEPGKVGLWQAMAMPMKKLKVGEVIEIQGKQNKHSVHIEDIFIAESGQKRLLVKLGNDEHVDQTFTILQDAGAPPLPPYIVQARHQLNNTTAKQYDSIFPQNKDIERYQTIFAREPGAVAAPTAGLHFSPTLLASLASQGIKIYEITLHVGPGTFKPITGSIEDHIVEPEWFSIPEEVCQGINAAKKAGQRIIAVGTTTCRALESAYVDGQLTPSTSYTPLFVKPGYTFKLIDGLITNFHLSKSSLLLLVAAFMGQEELMNTYKTAIEERYRFYSYGDAMIII